ncbi:MAG: AMP-binding protein [Rhodospirillaceae bacterium]|nr:AMP-binding protein [Rhodospirillaceae bacterium]
MSENLYALIAAQFPTDPAAVFLEVESGPPLLYREVDGRAARIAAALAAHGAVRGDRIVAQVDKSPDAVLLYLACLRAGLVFVPLNTAYTAQEVAFFLSDAEPAAFVCRDADRETAEALGREAGIGAVLTLGDGTGTLLDAAGKARPAGPPVARRADDLAAILYTSGTTGRPKGAMLTHGNLASNALILRDYWGFAATDVLLHALPIYHVHGLFVALHCALLSGARVIFQKGFAAERAIARLPDATVMMGVPTYYTRLLDAPEFTAEAARNVRLFISGSAPLLEETFAAFEARTGKRILERYGMTEAGMACSNPLDGERIAGTVGFALPGVSVRIADETGREVPRGTAGVLEMTGPNVFAGYWRLPEKTAEEFRPDGYFVSGDMAQMDASGRVTIVGRAKDLIISGGLNVYPKEVEQCLDALPGVRESAVFGVAHPDFGEGVTGVVVPDGSVQLDPEALLDSLAGRLARFKQPKRIVVVDEIPRNAMGKVQKKALRDRYTNIYTG